ncbi:hypothetical protein J0X19_17840 [Hymenobacter sp. BT186]|uniref:Uncharacterized protein n=1 Tax=Hymenobacter telluris TaxID=2816474 RepID=A0A939F039_9BACT|nr:hypothetical protein [Hymenobacter telluris]MBO0359827.1 hypothetical protein [Hymenobacter telluris]MBW3375854.1 hypothetical protein [Hymenobacter norwichensis]
MTTPTPKAPWYTSQWIWILVLPMIGLRFGYKTWRQEQRPGSAIRIEQVNERSRALEQQIRASQAASTAPVIVADSAVLSGTVTVGPQAAEAYDSFI